MDCMDERKFAIYFNTFPKFVTGKIESWYIYIVGEKLKLLINVII